MIAETGRLPRRDVFYPALSFLYMRGGTKHSPGGKQSRDNTTILQDSFFLDVYDYHCSNSTQCEINTKNTKNVKKFVRITAGIVRMKNSVCPVQAG